MTILKKTLLMFKFKDSLEIESCKYINPSRPNPGRREEIQLNFYFHTSLRCLKRFYEGLTDLHYNFQQCTGR